jgi:glycosyltransferase involved in cell wall biosynthesis
MPCWLSVVEFKYLFTNHCGAMPLSAIVSDGVLRLLVDPTRRQEIADAIEHLYNNRTLVVQMKQNALRAAKEKYNFASQAEKLLEFYKTM